MKKDSLKEKFAEIKAESFDIEETKELVVRLKEQLDREYEQFKGEVSREELWEAFIEDYNKELEYRGEANSIYNMAIQHVAMARLINSEKADRYTYNDVMRKARNREKENNKDILCPSLDVKETIVALVRSAMRYNPGIAEKRIIQTAPEQKEKIDSKLRKKLIDNIQNCARFLNFNGFIEDFINSANSTLEELGLQNIKYIKRNPVPDEEYDENGNIVKDKEDIGVIDAFDTTFLEKMPVEDLILMNMAWESQYFHKRLEMERTLFTIDALDLYDVFINGSIEDIKSIDRAKFESAVKKDMALTYIFNAKKDVAEKLLLESKGKKSKNEDFEEQAMREVVNSKLRRQYKKFLKENGLNEKEDIAETLGTLEKEFDNIYSAGADVSALQGIIIFLIENRALKLKKWGTVDAEKIFDGYKSDADMINIAIEHPGFRGPAVIEMPSELIETINERGGINTEIPKYKGYIDPKYCEIMSKLYIPATQYYKNAIKAEYKANPSSKFVASLAGKNAKDER